MVGPRRGPALVRNRVAAVIASLVVVSSVIGGCGPSEEEIRADINEVCVELIADLSELKAKPGFRRLEEVAAEAGTKIGVAGNRIEDISNDGPAAEFATALDALGGSYWDLGWQVRTRDYGALVQTSAAGDASLADALAAAESVGATDCLRIGIRARYFDIAAARAAAAAAEIAPTGDYVADVSAACARYVDDTSLIFRKLGIRASFRQMIPEDVELPYSVHHRLEWSKDLTDIGIALEVLIRDLALLAPPADVEATHAQLLGGYQAAHEWFRVLQYGGEDDELDPGADEVAAAAERLGVDCAVWVSSE